MSPALTVFLPAWSANFTASCATCVPYSSRASFSAALALSDTLSAPACLMSCSIAASGISRFEACGIFYHPFGCLLMVLFKSLRDSCFLGRKGAFLAFVKAFIIRCSCSFFNGEQAQGFQR